MQERTKQIALGLAAVQVLDSIGNEIPRKLVHNHLNHLGVPRRLRPLLSPIKVTTAAALVAGIERPRLRAVTSAGLVAYYAAAARFHLLAGDHPVIAVPAAVCGAAAAIVFLDSD